MDNFLGEIRNFGFGRIPKGWANCAGQIMSIQQNTALFSLLGTTYGGDGITTFALPDLRGKTSVNVGTYLGTPYAWGQQAGTESVTLNTTQLPAHNHFSYGNEAMGNNILNSGDDYPAEMSVFVSNPQSQQYAVNGFNPTNSNMVPLAPDSIMQTGGNQPHENRQPYLCINICIALQGVFPSRP
ncbi:phage tail protein [Emticicia sp. CRIBPO]|uniref:phage tail protein n=1 Tax=Emticicia sp. CRIBPO TaxID=2683258 RepID=UPI0014134137|nr:tail fiber protein [Emticicia sp. CRIBPO]NBA88063.1 phage tail protein [Emticicia sp. CRIBPO]